MICFCPWIVPWSTWVVYPACCEEVELRLLSRPLWSFHGERSGWEVGKGPLSVASCQHEVTTGPPLVYTAE